MQIILKADVQKQDADCWVHIWRPSSQRWNGTTKGQCRYVVLFSENLEELFKKGVFETMFCLHEVSQPLTNLIKLHNQVVIFIIIFSLDWSVFVLIIFWFLYWAKWPACSATTGHHMLNENLLEINGCAKHSAAEDMKSRFNPSQWTKSDFFFPTL